MLDGIERHFPSQVIVEGHRSSLIPCNAVANSSLPRQTNIYSPRKTRSDNLEILNLTQPLPDSLLPFPKKARARPSCEKCSLRRSPTFSRILSNQVCEIIRSRIELLLLLQGRIFLSIRERLGPSWVRNADVSSKDEGWKVLMA